MLPGFRFLSGIGAALLAAPLPAQTPSLSGPEPPTAPVAVLTAAMYNEQANLREATDSAKAVVATEVLRGRLRDRLGDQAVDYQLVDSLAAAPTSLQLTGGAPCTVKVACGRAVGAGVGARWVVLTKVSKTSNLIWLLTAQLVRVSTGEIILDDSTELKGDTEPMVRVGVRNFADRVARTVRNRGYATNFPPAAPSQP